MDPTEILPPEIFLRVLEYLPPRELCRCLGVSRCWRQLANSDCLWRRFCKQLDKLPTSDSQDGGPLRLQSWSRTYIEHMSRLTLNWLTNTFTSHQIRKENWLCCIACTNSVIAVYYPRDCKVLVYNLDYGLEPFCSLEVDLPEEELTAIPDIFLTRSHLVLVRGSCLAVYQTSLTGFNFRSYISLTEDGGQESLLLADTPPLRLRSEKRLYVKVSEEDVLWLESEAMYIVDMSSRTYRVVGDTYRCLRTESGRVFAANDEVSIFSLRGEKEWRLEVRRVAELWVSGDFLATLIGWEDQELQIYRISNKEFISCFRVSKDPTGWLSGETSKLYLLELDCGLQKISCTSLDGSSADVDWVFTVSFCREPLVHPEMRLICNRFLFVRPSFIDDEKFILLETGSGNLVYESQMPPCLLPPAFIYHLSDEVFVTAETSYIHIRSYR